jgi:hypothetical protein
VSPAPQLRVEIESCAPDGDAWHVVWRVHNDGATALALDAAWIPHGRFRGEGRVPLSGTLEPGAHSTLAFRVYAAEAPGTIVENAFLILRVTNWRIFTRMRIEFDKHAVPHPSVEHVRVQRLESRP